MHFIEGNTGSFSWFVLGFFSEEGTIYGMIEKVKITESSTLGCNTLLHPLLMAEKVIESFSKPVQTYSCIFIFH